MLIDIQTFWATFSFVLAFIVGKMTTSWWQDNRSACHREQVVNRFKQNNSISCISKRLQSSDFNSMENLHGNALKSLCLVKDVNVNGLDVSAGGA